MRRPGGYVTITTPCPTTVTLDNGLQRVETHAEGVIEMDAFSCFHCGRIVHVMARCDPADLGGHCKICDKLVCPQCYGKGNCDPWEKQMQRAEASYHARRSYGI